jgi:hypothetical protein
MFTQDVLHASLARRVRAACLGPDVAPAEPSVLPSLEELAADERTAPDTTAIGVLGRFDPAGFAQSSVAFALGVRGRARAEWFRAFTRTLFLAGSPANLAARFPFASIAADGSVGWLGPAPLPSSAGLRRLLKRFDGDAECDPPAAVVEFTAAGPPGGTVRHCHVATAGVSLTDYMVHVNHVLAEAVLVGEIRPGDRVVLTHAPRLSAADGPYAVLRVHRDSAHPDRLRAYAGVCSGQGHV